MDSPGFWYLFLLCGIFSGAVSFKYSTGGKMVGEFETAVKDNHPVIKQQHDELMSTVNALLNCGPPTLPDGATVDCQGASCTVTCSTPYVSFPPSISCVGRAWDVVPICAVSSCESAKANGHAAAEALDVLIDDVSTPMFCDNRPSAPLSGGWMLVRHWAAPMTVCAPPTETDTGTVSWGTNSLDPVSTTSFGIKYNHLAWNETMYSFGDLSKWIVFTKEVINTTGNEDCYVQNDVVSSSAVAGAHTVAQCFRSKAEDPWITVVDHMPLITHESDSDFLWCEANYSGDVRRFVQANLYGGWSVYIR